MGWYDYSYPPYVPVAQRKAQAAREVEKRLKKGQKVSPVKITGRPTNKSGMRRGKTSDTCIPPQSILRSVMAG